MRPGRPSPPPAGEGRYAAKSPVRSETSHAWRPSAGLGLRPPGVGHEAGPPSPWRRTREAPPLPLASPRRRPPCATMHPFPLPVFAKVRWLAGPQRRESASQKSDLDYIEEHRGADSRSHRRGEGLGPETGPLPLGASAACPPLPCHRGHAAAATLPCGSPRGCRHPRTKGPRAVGLAGRAPRARRPASAAPHAGRTHPRAMACATAPPHRALPSWPLCLPGMVAGGGNRRG